MPRHSAWKATICTIAARLVPFRRMSAIVCLRSGTVSSIALNANRKPSSALIAAKKPLAWLLGRSA